MLRNAALLGLLLASAGPVWAEGRGELRVLVRDARTGTPLEGAEVTVVTGGADLHGTTDSGGVALFHGEAGAIVRVTVRKDDYVAAATRSIVQFGSWHPRKLVLRLSPTCLDCVRIVDRAALISLEETAHVTVFSREFLDDLPLRGR